MWAVFLGAPGCGKGTQAQKVSERCGIPKISTGDILRQKVRAGSDLGNRAKGYMERGELVPDEIMLGLLLDRLNTGDTDRGFVLDGFPRTLPQAKGLDSLLAEQGNSLDVVIYFKVNPQLLTKRLSARRTCSKCGAVYNLITNPPSDERVCDLCGGELLIRDDDREETVKGRLKVFEKETAPLTDFYESKGILFPINGDGGVERVCRRIEEVLKGKWPREKGYRLKGQS